MTPGAASPIGVNDSDQRMVETLHTEGTPAAAAPARRPVVVLVGVPGAGKSTVGQALAERLGVGFRDTDADVESTTGRAIADIFVESGEAEFRRLEAVAVSSALVEHEGVLSLGGGAVVDPSTRALLVGAPVVWLRVGLAAASQRAGLSGARPVLLGNVRAQMKALMDARAPLYTEVARLIVDTDEHSVDDTVEAILTGLDLTASAAPVETVPGEAAPAVAVQTVTGDAAPAVPVETVTGDAAPAVQQPVNPDATTASEAQA
jgi:shikimate kinase